MADLSFLIDSLKEKLSREGKEDTDEEKFPDMNYLVGNTSGMDVSADIPSPLDQRIGRMAQIGGEIMEVQLANPATFKIDRPELMNVLNQLGLDIKLHADPNIGFTGAYATRGAQVQGYTVVHRYFKRYLEQLAGFKADKERRSEEKDGFNFDIGYVNVHASTEPIPGLEEQIASDVSVDPFGKPVKDVYAGDEDGKNIYRNKKFMENLFDYFLDEMFDRKNMYPSFSRFSTKFKKKWNDSKEQVANNIFTSDTDLLAEDRDISTRKKIRLVQNATSRDRGVETTFMEEAQDEKLDNPIEFQTEVPTQEDNDETREETSVYESLAEFMSALSQGPSISSLDGFLYKLQNNPQLPPKKYLGGQDVPEEMRYEPTSGEVARIEELLRSVLRSIWTGEDTQNDGKTFSLSAKQHAISNTLNDLNNEEFVDKADDEGVRKAARAAFSGDEEYFDDTDNDNVDLFHELIENTRIPIGREIDKESVMFFHVLPAWMQVADEEFEDHKGFPSAKFIWDHVVGNGYEGYDGFKGKTEDDREFQLDVIAAVGCSYIWGHFTQSRDNFEINEENYRTGDMFLEENDDYTWAQWMNKFGLKVNFEAMYGDPGSLLRVWRPKDIAIVCRAINMTAERNSSNWEEDYQGDIAKFTIDMEHTASFGVDPWPEMEELIEQETKLAQEGYGVDEDKPLADIVKTYHLTKPGFESSQSHRHGPFARGDKTLYRWLYRMVEAGFTRVGEDADPSVVMFEVGGEYAEEMFVIRVVLDMIRLGIEPKDVDPSKVPMDGEYENVKQQLIARFYGLDQSRFNREWAKIESHAFDPLEGLLEAEDFNHTWSGRAALENDMRPAEWNQEEFK